MEVAGLRDAWAKAQLTVGGEMMLYTAGWLSAILDIPLWQRLDRASHGYMHAGFQHVHTTAPLLI